MKKLTYSFVGLALVTGFALSQGIVKQDGSETINQVAEMTGFIIDAGDTKPTYAAWNWEHPTEKVAGEDSPLYAGGTSEEQTESVTIETGTDEVFGDTDRLEVAIHHAGDTPPVGIQTEPTYAQPCVNSAQPCTAWIDEDLEKSVEKIASTMSTIKQNGKDIIDVGDTVEEGATTFMKEWIRVPEKPDSVAGVGAEPPHEVVGDTDRLEVASITIKENDSQEITEDNIIPVGDITEKMAGEPFPGKNIPSVSDSCPTGGVIGNGCITDPGMKEWIHNSLKQNGLAAIESDGIRIPEKPDSVAGGYAPGVPQAKEATEEGDEYETCHMVRV